MIVSNDYYEPMHSNLFLGEWLDTRGLGVEDSSSEAEEDCPVLVSVPTRIKIPVTIITGFLGK